MLYAADLRWWEWHASDPDLRRFEGQRCTIMNTGGSNRDAEVFLLHNYGIEALSDKPNGLCTGSTSGYQAVNLAYLAGAKRIALIGYEMHFPGGRSHWHAGHPVKDLSSNYERWARNYQSMLPQLSVAGVEVINCTPDSRITAFRKDSLESVLSHP